MRRWPQKVAALYFVFATLMLVWPLFEWLGNHVEPRVLGMPWSMAYVLGIVVLNFFVLVGLYRFRVIDEPVDHLPASSADDATDAHD